MHIALIGLERTGADGITRMLATGHRIAFDHCEGALHEASAPSARLVTLPGIVVTGADVTLATAPFGDIV